MRRIQLKSIGFSANHAISAVDKASVFIALICSTGTRDWPSITIETHARRRFVVGGDNFIEHVPRLIVVM